MGVSMNRVREERNILVRIVSLLLWLPTFYILTNVIIGSIVGAIAGASTASREAGYQAGQQASTEFFSTFGIYILLAQILVFLALAFFGKLPWVSKYK